MARSFIKGSTLFNLSSTAAQNNRPFNNAALMHHFERTHDVLRCFALRKMPWPMAITVDAKDPPCGDVRGRHARIDKIS